MDESELSMPNSPKYVATSWGIYWSRVAQCVLLLQVFGWDAVLACKKRMSIAEKLSNKDEDLVQPSVGISPLAVVYLMS